MFFKSNISNFSKAILILENGDIFPCLGIGSKGQVIGELCFNTAMTGYQEAISDPSYASQILMFTFPHIGITGVNNEDIENKKIFLNGVIFRELSKHYSNWRSLKSLNNWLVQNNVIGVTNLNTRNLTIKIRENGALRATLINGVKKNLNIKSIVKKTKDWSGINDNDLAKIVSCKKPYVYKNISKSKKKIDIVAIDFGCKKNILDLFLENNFRVTVVPYTYSYDQIMKFKPKGVFLSNGPGDPFATSRIVLHTIKKLVKNNIPLFGICLGHQILGLALGANTVKMHHGHHGVNQPVKNLNNNKIEITSQNHGFMIDPKTLQKNIKVSHISLFDKSIQGIEHVSKPFFGIQYHPESSPGPHDSRYLFNKFREKILK
ncbi:glutamine-hydrolyzing carbamoyl-phosphate synthase small subunit [Alphaproteobacteria bacterium]|nr:glutamine-hydrolyzing carbamoyl-phosphate synthase small subunit [Alphaproteobacteria bacterium]